MVVETCLTGCMITSDYSKWLPTIFIAVLSVVLILSGLYMLSRLLGKREWEALAKTELWQTANAVLWVAIIGSVATLLCSLACQMSGDEDPFLTAATYLGEMQNKLESAISALLEGAKETRLKTAYALSIFDVVVMPWEGCSVLANNYEQMAFMLSPFVGSLIFQRFVLMIVSGTAFTLLLPIGIILRIIPFAREAGAFVIALAVALYIVLPLTYVFAERATSTVTFQIESLGRECVDSSSVKTTFSSIGNALPQAVFFPALSMIITIAAARVLSKVFTYDFIEMG